jgi:hypothetical protein
MLHRAWILASAVIALVIAFPFEASASTARLLTLDELLDRSTYVVIATPAERRSVWEDLPSGRRIVTYTRITIERAAFGTPGPELWVRTLGGAVDRIGQFVSGEAQLQPGARALLFLLKAGDVVVVTGMAQGHYPIVVNDEGVERLASSADTDVLVPRRGQSSSAREQLIGAPLESAESLIRQIRKGRK